MQRPPAAWSGGCLLEWKLYGSVGAGSKFIKILVHAHIFLLTFQVIGIDLPCSRKKRQTRIYIYKYILYNYIHIHQWGFRWCRGHSFGAASVRQPGAMGGVDHLAKEESNKIQSEFFFRPVFKGVQYWKAELLWRMFISW